MKFIKKILVPIDFSDYSKNALKYAMEFANSIDAKLHFVYVIEPLVFPADFSMGQISLPALDVETADRAKEELDTLVKSEFGDSAEVETIIKTGKPFVEINDCARELDIDLIIISSHGHTGVEHLLFGGTAEKVVKKAPCPVLSIREPIKGFKYKQCD